MNRKHYVPSAEKNGEKNRTFPRGALLFAALLCLGLSASDIPYAARKQVRTRPADYGFMVRPPEVKPVRDSARKRFTPAVPRTETIPFLRPEAELYTGATSTLEERIMPRDPKPTFAANSAEEPGFPPASSEETTIPPISRRPDNRISLKEEMISPDDLDTGKLGGMVLPGADGKQDARGFIRLPTVWGTQLHVPNTLKRAPLDLVEGVNRYSEMRAEASPHLYLSSERIFRTPFLFITTDAAFELTPDERRNFAEYLKNGGFAFIDNGTSQYENSAAEASLRQMVRDSLGSRAHFEPLPVNHPLYHCWFDFADGPPKGAEMDGFQTTSTVNVCGEASRSSTLNAPVFYLEGIFIGNRLVGVYSDKGYSQCWSRMAHNVPQLKMGVNLVVYALTREGGMNARGLERYSDIR